MANPLPWPEHINAAEFKANSNFFIGFDKTSYFKSLLSIRSMVGSGLVLSLILPRSIILILAVVMTLPQLFITLARHYRILRDPLREAHPVLRGRWAAEIDGDFCVFHIGIILNGEIPNKEMDDISKAFDAMHRELEADPEKYGFYGSTRYVTSNPRVDGSLTVQYWRSQDHLNAYARERMAKHFPAMVWSAGVMKLSAHVGFWHESFKVHAGEYEGVYVNCPRILLGKAGRVVPAKGQRRTARGRLGVTNGTDLDDVNLPENCY